MVSEKVPFWKMYKVQRISVLIGPKMIEHYNMYVLDVLKLTSNSVLYSWYEEKLFIAINTKHGGCQAGPNNAKLSKKLLYD